MQIRIAAIVGIFDIWYNILKYKLAKILKLLIPRDFQLNMPRKNVLLDYDR